MLDGRKRLVVYYLCAVSGCFASTLRGLARRRLSLLSYALLPSLSPLDLYCDHFFLTAEAAVKKKDLDAFPPPGLQGLGWAALFPSQFRSKVSATILGMIGVDPRAYCRSATTHLQALVRRYLFLFRCIRYVVNGQNAMKEAIVLHLSIHANPLTSLTARPAAELY